MAESPIDPQIAAAAADALLAGVVELIEDQRANLAASFAHIALEAAGTPQFCAKASRAAEPCDRPPEHHGECSWELAQAIRRYRDAEVRAARVPALENQLSTTRRRLDEATAALDAYRIPDPEDPGHLVLAAPPRPRGV